jgi:hypothetical protein
MYRGLHGALVDMGQPTITYDPQKVALFDICKQNVPDVFIGQGYNLDDTTIKCLNRYKDIQIILKVGAGSKQFNAEYEPKKYGVLMASDEEFQKVGKIENQSRITVLNYCHPNRVDYVIGSWKDLGYKTWGLLPAADTKNFYPVDIVDNPLKSDVAFIGGYWNYKGQNLNRYILPLCLPIGKYNIKIFGNQHWPVPQYMGYLGDEKARILLSTSTICPCVHEPHSNRYGFDVLARIFNVIACRGFCISDYVESIEKDIFTNGELPIFHNEEEFFSMIDEFIAHPEKREPYIEKCFDTVMTNHTYYNRAQELLNMVSI